MRRLAVLLLLLPLASCGTREPSDEEQVRETLAAFARSVEGRDYQKLCDEILAPDLLEGIAKIGLPCEVAMRNSLAEVRRPQLTVGAVDVDGKKATAEVRTSAAGQDPSRDTVTLVKTNDGWRVSDLGGGSQEEPPPRPTP
jgi:hypothetical protein